MNNLPLLLNAQESIVIESPVPLAELAEWDYAEIIFKSMKAARDISKVDKPNTSKN